MVHNDLFIHIVEQMLKAQPPSLKYRENLGTIFTTLNFVPANSILLYLGVFTDQIWFVRSGLIKGGENNEAGESQVLHLWKPGEFCSDLGTFLYAGHSGIYIKTVTDCELMVASRRDFNALDHYPEHQQLKAAMLLKENEKIRLRTQIRSMTAEQKVRAFEGMKLPNGLPGKDAASYMQMSPFTFSRLRSSLAREK